MEVVSQPALHILGFVLFLIELYLFTQGIILYRASTVYIAFVRLEFHTCIDFSMDALS